MGEIIKNKDFGSFTIKEDGTIVRSHICPKCGKESYSGNERCEYCGAKIVSNTPSENKSNDSRIWLPMVPIFIGIMTIIAVCL